MATSYNLMHELFIGCNLIRSLCNRLQTEAEQMQEVSMNAAIAAGHTGTHIKTFTEIARQIGNSSSRLSLKVQRMREKNNIIVNKTLAAMIRANHQSYFELSLPNIKGENNIRLIQSKIKTFEIQISIAIEEIFRELQLISSDIRTIEEIQKRVWAVITRLRIEASIMDPNEQGYVSSISDALDQSAMRTTQAFENLIETTREFESKLKPSCQTFKQRKDLKNAS